MSPSIPFLSLLALLLASPIVAQIFPNVTGPITVTVTAKVAGDPYFGVGFGAEYVVNGQHAPNITLFIGVPYNFSLSTTAAHPWYIGTSPLGLGNNVLYGGLTTGNFVYTPSAADAALGGLWYQCENHQQMGNSIFLVQPPQASSSTAAGRASSSIPSSSAVSSSAATSAFAPTSTPAVNSIGPTTTSLSVVVTTKVAGDPFFGVGFPAEYVVNGIHAPVITVYRGVTYNWTLSTTSAHPWYIGTSSTGQNQGFLYGGLSSGVFSWTPSLADQQKTLFYECQNHANLGNSLVVIDPPSVTSTPPTASSSTGVVTPSGLSSGSLCFLTYGLAGNIDYPWGVSVSLNFLYNASIRFTTAGPAVQLVSGTGTRTFNNRFGVSFSSPLSLNSAGSGDNLLYLSNTGPVDGSGLSWTVASPVQLPGVGPSPVFSALGLFASANGLLESSLETRVDAAGQAFLSTVPGFANSSIGASNINGLAVQYATCQAPVTFVNGLRPPTQPSVSNGAVQFAYSYFITDGVQWSVAVNLTITTTSGFATSQDQLGSPYQTVTNVTGVRVYTHVPSGGVVTSQVRSGFTTAPRFYPYALLSAAPGVYTINSAPFWDAVGLSFAVSPAVPLNGNAVGVGQQLSVVNVAFVTLNNSYAAALSEAQSLTPPSPTLQQQGYSL